MENIKKIKVINIAHWSRSGITSLIKTIIKNGNEFDNYFFLLDTDNEFDSFYADCNKRFQLNYSTSKISALAEFIRTVRKIQPDIIHAHSLVPLIFSAIFCGKAKIIYHLHCDYPFLIKSGLKFSIKRLAIWAILNLKKTKNITVSESSATALKKISKCDAEYVPNGIPSKGATRKSFTVESNKNRFYSVSRLDIEKNLPYAILLLSQLKKRGANVSYDIYGNGSEKNTLTKLIETLNISDTVRLMGFTNAPEELPKNYDFYLSTSTQEGLSLSALQGFRGYTPVITTAVGQIGLSIESGRSGFILTENISNDIALLENIISIESEALNEVQARAHKIYRDSFTETIFLDRIYSIYRSTFSLGKKS